jgi:CheY-like chemotaxis protein
MITGYANVADEARTAGADVVLLKPITPPELLAAIETALTQH